MSSQALQLIDYDPAVDAGYIKIAIGNYDESEEIAPGIILDYSTENQPIGIEILGTRDRTEASLNSIPEPYQAHVRYFLGQIKAATRDTQRTAY